MKLSQNYLNGTNVAVPVRELFTSTTVKQFYRFLPVYHGTNCPPYSCRVDLLKSSLAIPVRKLMLIWKEATLIRSQMFGRGRTVVILTFLAR